ncbi:MAG: hypothetical protein LRY42_02850, partial [Candidatus Pacebacteria bacterium]|nr:hypothetical protein [Candidatus Paceibacterota bacterium]
ISAQDQNNIFESENSVDIGSDHGFDNELTQQKKPAWFFFKNTKGKVVVVVISMNHTILIS